jgi:thiol-disulfide isomerase/thioredoxin
MRPLAAAALLSLASASCRTQAADDRPPVTAATIAAAPSSSASAKSGAPREGDELLGTTPHEWTVDHWMNSPPLTLAGLHGRVVLVRWFMSQNCDLCSATAPTLRAFDEQYRAGGLSIVGMYHHKDPEPLDPAKVAGTVKAYGYTFPVAIDTDWKTLKAWWLDGHDRNFTSVSFLLDKQGTVRFIHPGGKYEPGSADEREMRAQIEKLIRE